MSVDGDHSKKVVILYLCIVFSCRSSKPNPDQIRAWSTLTQLVWCCGVPCVNFPAWTPMHGNGFRVEVLREWLNCKLNRCQHRKNNWLAKPHLHGPSWTFMDLHSFHFISLFHCALVGVQDHSGPWLPGANEEVVLRTKQEVFWVFCCCARCVAIWWA